MSHDDSDIFYSILAYIDAENGNITKMTITQGKKHKYIGMNIEHSSPRKLILPMLDYIGNILDETPEDIRG